MEVRIGQEEEEKRRECEEDRKMRNSRVGEGRRMTRRRAGEEVRRECLDELAMREG